MMMNAVTTMHARTTSQMIVEWPRDAELFWFYRYFVVNFPGFYHGDFKRNGKWVAEEHQAMIRGLVPSENLLEWTVDDGWVPLCEVSRMQTLKQISNNLT